MKQRLAALGEVTYTIVPPVFVERRWRWSWMWMRWEAQTLSGDYVFRWDGGCLEGYE